jgi:hypothetical protein
MCVREQGHQEEENDPYNLSRQNYIIPVVSWSDQQYIEEVLHVKTSFYHNYQQ